MDFQKLSKLINSKELEYLKLIAAENNFKIEDRPLK
jgi:hypothetical protein